MRLRWTATAADDLQHIADYLFEKTPENAAQLIRKIYDAPSKLKEFPNLGVRARSREHVSCCFLRFPTSWSTKWRTISSISCASFTARRTGHCESRVRRPASAAPTRDWHRRRVPHPPPLRVRFLTFPTRLPSPSKPPARRGGRNPSVALTLATHHSPLSPIHEHSNKRIRILTH